MSLNRRFQPSLDVLFSWTQKLVENHENVQRQSVLQAEIAPIGDMGNLLNEPGKQNAIFLRINGKELPPLQFKLAIHFIHIQVHIA